jgi:hypothetical protein
VVTIAGRKLAIDNDRCVGILRECGFLPTQRFGVVDLGCIPDGLNAKETERFLRKRGAELCGPVDLNDRKATRRPAKVPIMCSNFPESDFAGV